MLKLLSYFTTPGSILIFCLLSTSFSQAEVGFTQGAVFSAIPIQGEVRIECAGFNGNGSAVYTCRDVILAPTAYDHFIGPKESQATKLELISNHEDGSSRSRVSNYLGGEGRSEEAINLWISNLFQKPLLEKGRNKVQYRVGTDRDVLAQGEFSVDVRRGKGLLCPLAEIKSTDINDCHSQYSVCQRYFADHNNCQ